MSDGLVRDGELAEVVADHVRLDLDLKVRGVCFRFQGSKRTKRLTSQQRC